MSSDDDSEAERSSKRRKTLSPLQLKIAKYRSRIQNSLMPSKGKQEAIHRLENMKEEKSFEWLDTLLKIPFGKFTSLPVDKQDTDATIKKYFEKVSRILDEAVFAMQSVKEEVLNFIAQFISTDNKSAPRILGLCGSPGIGKTAIIRRGFSKALRRPIECMSMGGIRDSNYFLGHDFTYVGSRPGIFVQSLINLGCMNGIIFMDEVDKISQSYDGVEIQNLLIHITDPVQNSTFHDKYFAGIDIDLSKIIFIFSFNDEKLLDPILRDRIHIIHVPDPTLSEKVMIGHKYLLREIQPNIGLDKSAVLIDPSIIEYIIKHYCTDQKGVRMLKRCLETVLMKLNTARYLPSKLQKYKSLDQIKLPFTVTIEVVTELLKDMKKPEDKYLTSMYL